VEPGCTLNWGAGNMDTDPLFRDPGYRSGAWFRGDYHPYPCSAAIDAGEPGADYSEEPEWNGSRVNMGMYGNTSEAAPLSFDTSSFVILPDISGNGVSELAVLSQNWITRKIVVQAKDLSTGLLVKAVWFSNMYRPLALETVPDLNSNGSSELALLSVNPNTGKVTVQIKDSSTGLLVRNVWFSTTYTPLDLKELSDINGNSAPELVVLSTDWVSGKVVAQVKDSSTGLLIRNVWFSSSYMPMTLETVPDLNSNGSPELAVLSMNPATGKVLVQVKDSFTGLLVKNVWFSNVYEPLALEVVPDINANSRSELAVLSMNPVTNKVVVQVKDSFTGLLVRNAWFSTVYKPLSIKIVPDINANGSSELGVLSMDYGTGKVVSQIKDAFTGLLVGNVWLSNVYAPAALLVAPDLNANGKTEQAVLSMNSSTGKVVVQIKDSSTGLLVKNIWY